MSLLPSSFSVASSTIEPIPTSIPGQFLENPFYIFIGVNFALFETETLILTRPIFIY